MNLFTNVIFELVAGKQNETNTWAELKTQPGASERAGVGRRKFLSSQ